MTSVPTNSHVNQHWLNKRSQVEKCEAEFNLLTDKEQMAYFRARVRALANKDEEAIAESLLANVTALGRTTLWNRMVKMYMHSARPEEIAAFRRESRKVEGQQV